MVETISNSRIGRSGNVVSKPELDKSLLPFYQEWKTNQDPEPRAEGVLDYLYFESDHEMAAAFSKLFWPDFVEVEGCVFLAERFPKLSMSAEEFSRKMQENPRSIEFTVNYLNIPYIFFNDGRNNLEFFSPELFVYMAQVLLVCWKHALQEAFPDRKFEFWYEIEHETDCPKISFWQAED